MPEGIANIAVLILLWKQSEWIVILGHEGFECLGQRLLLEGRESSLPAAAGMAFPARVAADAAATCAPAKGTT